MISEPVIDFIRSVLDSVSVGEDDDASIEALLQVRDIFEMIFVASAQQGNPPDIAMISNAEKQFVTEVFAANGIMDHISFQSLLGCADLMLDAPERQGKFQARGLFQILLRAIVRMTDASQ